MQRPHFVPESTMGSRTETAVLLVGTAREFDIPQRSILSTSGGFWITDELAAIIYDDSEQDEVSGNDAEPVAQPEPKAKSTSKSKKASGNRAAKNQPTEKE